MSAETETANVFFMAYKHEFRDGHGNTVIPLVPMDRNAAVVFETRTGKVQAYLDEEEQLIVCSYNGPHGIIVRPESDNEVKIVAEPT